MLCRSWPEHNPVFEPPRRGIIRAMRRRSRTRRVLKWVGLVGCVLMLAAWGFSLFWSVSYICAHHGCGLGYGYAVIAISSKARPFNPFTNPEAWEVERATGPLSERLGGLLHWQRFGYLSTVFVPLWMPFVLLALPTAFLWHRDRRPPKGHCQGCGYDLTGNVSGICSECGEAT